MGDIKSKIISGSVSQYFYIIISTLIGVIKAPIGINYFGAKIYGIWLVITSIISYLSLTQLGIGPAIITLLSQTKSDIKKRKIIITALKLVIYISLGIIIVLALLNYFNSDWYNIFFNVDSELEKLTKFTVSIMIIVVSIKLPVVIFKSSFSGMNKVIWNKIYSSFTAVLGFVALLITIHTNKSLIFLAFLTGISNIIIGIISGLHLFAKLPEKPSMNLNYTINKESQVNKKYIIKTGSIFFLLTIANTILFQTDNIIISSVLGTEYVTSYAITFRVYNILLQFINALTVSLWPIYGSLSLDKNWNKINKIYNNIVFIIVFLGGLAWIGGINFSKVIIGIWVGKVGYAGIWTSLFLGGFVFLYSFIGGANTSLINGINPSKIVPIVKMISALLNLILSLIFIRFFGISGVALATFISLFIIDFWFGPYYISKRTDNKVFIDKKLFFKLNIIVLVFVILSFIKELFFLEIMTSLLIGGLITLIYLLIGIKFLKGNDIFNQQLNMIKLKLNI